MAAGGRSLPLAQAIAKIADQIVESALNAAKALFPRIVWGVVTATASGPNRITVKPAGSATAIAGIRYLASYSPTITDTVVGLQIGSDYFVLGKIA